MNKNRNYRRTVSRSVSAYLRAADGDSPKALRAAVNDLSELRRSLLQSPPPGWVVFGTHAGMLPSVPLEFWGTDTDGLPIWERPKLTEDAQESAEILYPSDHEVDDPFGATGVARSDPYGYHDLAQQAFLRGVQWRDERV